ncbi:ATP-binding protein, partial [Streptomyces prunicolor]
MGSAQGIRSKVVDETPEFSGQALDALRQPLEAGHVVIA